MSQITKITASGGSASTITTNTSNFDWILSASDTTVQLALDTIDDWNKTTEVTGTSVGMTTRQSYILNNAGLVTATLPATSAVGDRISVIGKGSGGWTIAQNAGQTIHFISSDTTTGVGGSLSSTTRYDCVELVCITANTDFVVRSSVGNITVV